MKTRILMMLAALWLGTQVAEGARETTSHTFFDLKNHRDSVERTLNEVIVKATKVKFTYKGDTLVFNANAFNMPEGSRLGSLIKQLYGVEFQNHNGQNTRPARHSVHPPQCRNHPPMPVVPLLP